MRKVLIGVTGSIAIYKICDLIRDLKRDNFEVKVIFTPFSEKFVGRLTWNTLTGNRSFCDWGEDPLAHINLARWADIFLIAPCSINTLSKLAMGIGDNLLTTTFLAYDKPAVISPVANPAMYEKNVVKEHIERLKAYGHIIVEPDYGFMVCEEEGVGKLPPVDRLKEWIYYMSRPKMLEGKKALVTCGATREYIDRVRFISNESSGEMGFSLARVLRWYGAEVKIIAGFTTAKEPYDIEIERVVSAEDMYRSVHRYIEWADLVFMNAAVSDIRPLKKEGGKLKKENIGDRIEVELNKDILESICRNKGNTIVVGFSVETDNLIERAKSKLIRKNADFFVVNPSHVMSSNYYEGYFIDREGRVEEIRKTDKLQASEEIIMKVISRM